MTGDLLGDLRFYTRQDFEQHRAAEWGRSDEQAAQRHLERCVDALELLLRAAAKPGGGKVRDRLPGLVDSFVQWCEEARENFQLERGIDEQLEQRKFKAGVTLSYGEWRRMARRDPEALKAAGFKDDRRKGDKTQLRLELALAPGWAPGRSMRASDRAVSRAILPPGSAGGAGR